MAWQLLLQLHNHRTLKATPASKQMRGFLTKKFIINSAILSPKADPKECAIGAPKMLIKAGIKDVTIRGCYCCGPEGRIVFIIEAKNTDVTLEALNKINIPVASIMEVEEVKQ